MVQIFVLCRIEYESQNSDFWTKRFLREMEWRIIKKGTFIRNTTARIIDKTTKLNNLSLKNEFLKCFYLGYNTPQDYSINNNNNNKIR